jgi:hypothetical protein
VHQKDRFGPIEGRSDSATDSAKISPTTNHHDQAMGPVGRLFRSINKKGKAPTAKKGQKMGSCQSTEAEGVKRSTTSKQTRSGAKSAKGESFFQSGDFFSFFVQFALSCSLLEMPINPPAFSHLLSSPLSTINNRK